VFPELHASSAFSFLDGASLPEALVARAAELGYSSIALLDRDGVYGLPRFHLAAKRAGLKAIVGAELTVAVGTRASVPGARGRSSNDLSLSNPGARIPSPGSRIPDPGSRIFALPLLVSSREGYRNLCRLITRMKLRSPKGEGALTLEDLDGHVGGLVALVGRTAIDGPRFGVGGLVDRLVGVFGAEGVAIELQRHLLRDEESDNHALIDLASAYRLPVVATNGVRFAEPADRPLYDVLTCIRHKTTLAHAGRRLTWNAERYLKAPDAMARLFSDLPEALTGARALAERLEYTMADLGYRFPDYPVPAGETMVSFLRKMTQAGARERYRPYHDRARRQVARELDLIEKLDLAGYFLIVWDIVNYCRQEDILVQGRGSAANSAVCYSLGITAVDPVGMDLLFERFLSEERGEWPDIDLDLPSGDRRERVIQHIYEKYGTFRPGPDGPPRDSGSGIRDPGSRAREWGSGDRDAGSGSQARAAEGPRVAMTANVITYRGRSAAREVGKVLSLEPSQVDRLAKVMNHFEWVDPKETLDRNLREVGLDFHDPTIQLFGRLWQQIQDLPRHLGQHSGGMVMCHGRLDDIVPLENASMPDRVVVQWDKDDCADMGLVKVDLLGLGMMAVLQDALCLVNTQRETGSGERVSGSGIGDQGSGVRSQEPGARSPEPGARISDPRSLIPDPDSHIPDPVLHRLDLAHLPPDDPAVYKMLQEADTVGIFQVESRAQMATLPRLRPQRFYDIVVEVAIIRPGPIVGQMVHPYLKRRQGAEPVVYPHSSLEPILARTLGVPLFQEQLLRMAMVAAGFTGGEAEELRRAFGFKRSEKRMQQIEIRLREGMARQGIAGDAAEEIIRSITSFALYGFPESHAASFALLVYASAYLKAHYPAAFFTAMLNNQPMGFYHPATLVKDAQRHGVRFAPIDVQVSDWECRVEPDGRIRLGLMYVNGLREATGRAMAAGILQQDAGRTPAVTQAGGARATKRWPEPKRCPKCGCDDESMLEDTPEQTCFCNICAYEWGEPIPPRTDARPGAEEEGATDPGVRYRSLEALITSTGVRRDELATLAEIGALNAFGHHRRSALWQIERAVRPSGELFREDEEPVVRVQLPTSGGRDTRPEIPPSAERRTSNTVLHPPNAERRASSDVRHPPSAERRILDHGSLIPDPATRIPDPAPLRPMTPPERLLADYAGTSLTIGPHPLALRRAELALRGVLRARDLPQGRHGRRVRVAGAVITRQRPGTAKGFVFLTLEDETGIANIIVRPDLFTEQRSAIIGAPYLLIEGTLQLQEGVTSIKAERVLPLAGDAPEPQSHDFR
jgi:error-prone DNA polymerase